MWVRILFALFSSQGLNKNTAGGGGNKHWGLRAKKRTIKSEALGYDKNVF